MLQGPPRLSRRPCRVLGLPSRLCNWADRSWLAYEAAAERTRAWGDLVRSAFDLFLPELAKKMGYTLPSEREQRRWFWQDATSSFLYNMPMPATWLLAAEIAARAGGQTPLLESNDPASGEPGNAEPDEAIEDNPAEANPIA
jgi:hypothetical protein